MPSLRAGLYARVSTLDQEPENQLAELRRYCEARGWTATEFVDRGVSGSKDRRPALDELIAAAKRRRFDVVVCWRLDRLGRNLRHLVVLLDELTAMGVSFVSLNEGIDLMTPAGRLQLHILAAPGSLSGAAFKSAFELGSRVCAHKAGGWAGNSAPFRTNGSQQSRISPRGRPPSASAYLIPWSPAGAL